MKQPASTASASGQGLGGQLGEMVALLRAGRCGGRILLQTEAAEMFVRRYELHPLGKFTEKWTPAPAPPKTSAAPAPAPKAEPE